MKTDYQKTLPFSGDPQRALDLAIATLTGCGFRIDSRTESSLHLTGPGMNNSRENALLGASQIQIRITGSELSCRRSSVASVGWRGN